MASARNPFADYFPQSTNLFLRGLFNAKTSGVELGSMRNSSPHKFSVFSNVASRFLKTINLR